jgi:ribonuclease VapC
VSDVPRYVLDTSAILTLIEDEDGADRVEEILRSGKVLLPWTVLLEINYITRQESGETEADRRYAMLRESPVTILWNVDEPLILAASRMKARHRISFADSMI